MLWITSTNKKLTPIKSASFRGALVSSGMMAFAGMGDALLYPVLPVYGKNLGFSVLVIGLLLSVNRFVRILSNTPIANTVNQFGMKKVLIATATLATATTFFYSLGLGLISFLIVRILWGLSYSGLKIATLNYAALTKKNSGMAFGFSQSIKTLGSFFVLWFGPIVISSYGFQIGFSVIAILSSISIFLALSLPKISSEPTEGNIETKKTFYPSTINILVFLVSVTVDGILVVTLSNLLANDYTTPNKLLAIVAFYLLLKRLFVFLLSFISSFLTLKIPTIKLFNIALIATTTAIFFNFV